METSRIIKIFQTMNIASAEKRAKSLEEALLFFNIKDDENILLFIANILHESNCLKNIEENLNYKSAERLKTVFPSAFRNKFNPKEYINNPKKLGDLVYNDNLFPLKKLGNGDNEGFKFRGRGAIMTTGKNNYKALENATGYKFTEHPDLLLSDDFVFWGAVFFWKSNKINSCKTLLETRQKITGNRGTNPIGLKEVIKYFDKIKMIK